MVFYVVSYEFLWFYIGSYVSFPKPICYMKFKVKLKLYDLVP